MPAELATPRKRLAAALGCAQTPEAKRPRGRPPTSAQQPAEKPPAQAAAKAPAAAAKASAAAAKAAAKPPTGAAKAAAKPQTAAAKAAAKPPTSADKVQSAAAKSQEPPATADLARLERAAAAFRPGALTQGDGRLPCRDAEHGEILKTLRFGISAGGSAKVLYISGMPGTGKTASVNQAIKQLAKIKGLPAFVTVKINAMSLATPNVVFGNMIKQLPGATACAVSAACGELTKYFSERRAADPVVLLIIDEIDQLVTRNQAVLYKVFDWLQLPRARLVISAISNTMDLPERLLPRVVSRFSVARVDFSSYHRDQLWQILRKMLSANNAVEAFDDDALGLCAAKVGCGSGDVRKALQVCRRSVDLRTMDTKAIGPVGMDHVREAFRQLVQEVPAAQAVSLMGVKKQRLLASVFLELRRRNMDAVPMGNVVQRYAKLHELAPLAVCRDDAPPDVFETMTNEVLAKVRQLEAMALLATFEHPTGGRMVHLGRGLDTEDLVGVLTRDSKDDVAIRDMVSAAHRSAYC